MHNAVSGIYERFPKIKPYLKSYKLGPQDLESEELPRLHRYADSGEFLFRYAPGLSEHRYNGSNADADLCCVGIVKRWFAIQDSLSGKVHWQANWQAALGYEYWATRIRFLQAEFALTEFRSGKREQLHTFLIFDNLVNPIGMCLSLGWTKWALELTKWVYWAIDNQAAIQGHDDFCHRRTQHFLLRLIGSWQCWPERDGPSCAFDEPVFNELIAHWRCPDPMQLAPLLLAACDRHTFQARVDASGGRFYDLRDAAYTYVPYEVLAVLRLRQLLGLPNPDAAALNHPLMNTPLGQLPEVVAPYTDELLEGVVARARQQFPAL